MDLLMRYLKVPRYVAVGILESLWHLTAREAPRGDIGKLSDERIAVGIDYRGSASNLVGALTRAGWIDTNAQHRLLIHDWHDHADESVKKYLKRNGLQFACLDTSGHVETCLPRARALPVPVPVPEPVPEGSGATDAAAPPKPATLPPPLTTWQADETYQPFVEAVRASGAPVIDEDFADTYWAWKSLSWEQRKGCTRAFIARAHAPDWDPAYFRNVRRFVEREWKRPIVIPRAKSRDSPDERKRRVLEEAMQLADQQEREACESQKNRPCH
jgi:hypothetical protein